jgi:ubiquinone/menaquinone biosynthesis C-methylase UbiE
MFATNPKRRNRKEKKMADAIVKTECGCAPNDSCDILEFMAKEVGMTVLHPGGIASTQMLAQALGLPSTHKEQKMLDIACGKGTSSLYFAKNYGVTVTGIDIDPELLEYAEALRNRKGKGLNLSFVQGNAEHLPFGDNSFDVISFQAAMVLIENTEHAIAEAARVLKPGGKVGLLEITWLKPPTDAIIKEAGEKVCAYCITRAKTKEGWAKLITSTGLKLVHSSTHENISMNDGERFSQILKVMWKMLTKIKVRNRMQAIKTFFKHSRGYFGYGIYVGKK